MSQQTATLNKKAITRKVSKVVHEVPGRKLELSLLAPGAAMAWEVKKGQILRVVEVEGQQVGDFFCFNLHRFDEKLSPPNTTLLNKTIRLTRGHSLYSDEASKMFTIIKDTVGEHDILAGACSRYTNKVRYGVDATPNCRDNIYGALQPYGIGWKDIPYPFNIFMNVPVGANNSLGIAAPTCKAGDHIDLRAEMDCLAAISNCPQVLNPCNNFTIKPLMVVVYSPSRRFR